MQQQYKPYLIAAAAFMLSLYLLAFVLLALLTTINHAADYPLYNFLGSNIDLSPAVLQLLPAQNTYHLQKWNSLPLLSTILSLLFLVLSVTVTVQFARRIRSQGWWKLIAFSVIMLLLGGLTFAPVYASIWQFMQALAQA